MYAKIVVPVDLEHADKLAKALKTAADLANHYGVTACYVGVTPNTPTSIAAKPEEFATKLAAFAANQAQAHGHIAESQAVTSHDPATDLDDVLMRVIDEQGADLVVMASHVPNVADYIWPSNGGKIAAHSKASVFVVR